MWDFNPAEPHISRAWPTPSPHNRASPAEVNRSVQVELPRAAGVQDSRTMARIRNTLQTPQLQLLTKLPALVLCVARTCPSTLRTLDSLIATALGFRCQTAQAQQQRQTSVLTAPMMVMTAVQKHNYTCLHLQLRHHLETNRIDCNYNNNTINNININTRAGPRLEKLKL